jgi:excisionase family DNA binding protein
LVYTVEEASARLGVPRPTLYRYLREYSIPYTRRSGRISIPEGSLARIRTVRELHDEGLGTEAVRRRLKSGEGVDVDWIAERLDKLSEALEGSQTSLKAPEGVSSSQALHIILARQSLLISAVFNLTEMMEELLAATGRPRRSAFDFLERESRGEGRDAPLLPSAGTSDTLETVPVAEKPARRAALGTGSMAFFEDDGSAPRRERFGTLARRRRRAVALTVAILSVLAALGAYLLVFGLPG